MDTVSLTETCIARVSEPPHYFYSHVCGKTAKFKVGDDLPVCGTHRRVFEKWETYGEGRGMEMARHWWLVEGDGTAWGGR